MPSPVDAGIFYIINHGCANPVFDILMPLISEIGSGEGIFILSFLPLFLAKKEKKRAAILLWAGLSITYYIVYFLKSGVARPRPFMQLPDVRLLVTEKSFSFPSGHAVQAFMAATVASRYFRGGVLFFASAALVAFSRVYIGVHYVSDVLAGALIGILVGYGLAKFFCPPETS